MPQITTDLEDIKLVEVNTPTMNLHEDSNSVLDEMRQEMMQMMDQDIRDSVVQVSTSGMKFNIIKNRKGEKILSIQGFKNEEYGDEADDTVFVNLNKLLKDGGGGED